MLCKVVLTLKSLACYHQSHCEVIHAFLPFCKLNYSDIIYLRALGREIVQNEL